MTGGNVNRNRNLLIYVIYSAKSQTNYCGLNSQLN